MRNVELISSERGPGVLVCSLKWALEKFSWSGDAATFEVVVLFLQVIADCLLKLHQRRPLVLGRGRASRWREQM